MMLYMMLWFVYVQWVDYYYLTEMVKIVDNYTLTDYLGKGEYGKVYRAFHIDTKIQVAIKMVQLDKFSQVAKLVELTKNQIETLRLVEDNINIVKFVEMIKTNNYIYLVYEYCEGGTLEDLIKSRKRLTEKQALMIFKQLIFAEKALYQNYILHRDIKPNNIFFKSGHLKLADFGFCKRLRGADDFTQTSLGSPLYMAPQILNGDVYGSKIDVWSCGIVLFQMLFGYCPYGHCNIKEMLDIYNTQKLIVSIPSKQIPISGVTEMMLRRMLEKDQFRRISWQDFFYEYEITSNGAVLKKQKDFEYDLMKLMKKNSVVKRKKEISIKFDWKKITQKNSSVHSEQLSRNEIKGEQELNDFLILKKKVKEYENEHVKMLQMTLVLESLLECSKDFQYSNTIIYFLVHNLSSLVTSTLKNIEEYTDKQQNLLTANPNEANQINKVQIVFQNEAKSITNKTNSIKVTLMQCQTLNKEIFSFPNKSILRRYLKEYIEKYENNSKGASSLGHQGSRQQTLFLYKIVWGCIVCCKESDWSEKQMVKWQKLRQISSMKPEISKFEISVQLNKILVFLGL